MESCLPPEILTEIPGPRSRELAARLKKSESRNVTFVSSEFPVFWERAEGGNVWDVDGNRYVDLTSAFGVATMGFSHGSIRSALEKQAGKLWHAMGDVHPTESKVLLCERLAALTYGRIGMDARVVLCSSGFEAVEAAMMTAHLATGRSRFLAFHGGYHGLGFGARDATGWGFFRDPMRRILAETVDFVAYPGCEHCPLEPYRKEIRNTISAREHAAVIVEPVQGRGGVIIPPHGFLRMLREECDRTGTLLIFDEIFTGFWRTGFFLACDAEGIMPDLLCLGKALGGGFPISACVGQREVMDAWPESRGEALHTSTHLGNPLGCAMALAALEIMGNDDFLRKLRKLSEVVKQEMQRLTNCFQNVGVRGRGLFWAINPDRTLKSSSVGISQELMLRGLKSGYLLLQAGQAGEVISLSPPVTLSKTIFTQFTENLIQVYKEIASN